MTHYRTFEKTTPIIDGHAHMGAFRNFHIPRNDAQGMVERFDEVGIDVACVSHHAGISADFRFGNSQVLEAVHRFPDHLIGFCVVNPNYPEESQGEIEKCFDSRGFRGFKVHPELHGDYPLDGAGYEAMWEFADQERLPVLSHSYAGGDSLATFERLARRYPGAAVMLGHSGLDLGLENAARVVERTENVYLDMTAMQRHCGAVEFLASRVDAGRLTWGSDSPFIDPGPILGAVALADIPEAVRSAILYENLARLLRITVTNGRIEETS